MKKILFTALAVVAMGFASCGNQTNPSETVDSTAVDTVDTVITDTIESIAVDTMVAE